MASGMGVRGTVGRCYGFFADYKECQVRVRVCVCKSGSAAAFMSALRNSPYYFD